MKGRRSAVFSSDGGSEMRCGVVGVEAGVVCGVVYVEQCMWTRVT